MRLDATLDSFLDEMTKIAKTKKEREQEKRLKEFSQASDRATMGATTPLLLNYAVGKLTPAFDKKHGLVDPDAIHSLSREVQQGMGRSGTPTHMMISSPGGKEFDAATGVLSQDEINLLPPGTSRQFSGHKEFYQHTPEGKPGKHFVQLPNKPHEATIAHEFGHISNTENLPRFKVLSRLSRKITTGGPKYLGGRIPLVPLAAGAWAGAEKDPSWTPGAVNAAVAAPLLAEEGMATARAVKYMAKKHGLGQGLWKSKSLLPAFGTYAALGLGPLAVTGARKVWKRHTEKKGKEKKAAEGMGGALAGGMIGGGLGALFKSPKAALVGGLVGAGIGGLAGGAVHAVRRFTEPTQVPGPIPGDPSYVPTWQSGPPNMGYSGIVPMRPY